MPLHDTSYKHWQGAHLGLWGRRAVIATNGLSACLQVRGMRGLVTMCWGGGLVMTALLFVVGQLLVADSVVVQWMSNLNPALQAFAALLTTWLEQHPEISVRTTQNVLFYYFAILLMRVSIFALGLAIPLLITRDLASNAIIIYASKAVSRGDYLLGKFATAFGLLTLTWLGPLCGAWFLGNLLAPDWGFFWHSRAALAHILTFGLCGMSILSLLAMGISAVSTKEKATPGYWYLWWICAGVIGPIAVQTRPWLQHLSFNYDLNQIALAVFRLGTDLKIAQDNVPVLGELLRNIKPQTLAALNHPALGGASLALALMLGLAVGIVARRVKPE